MSQDQEIAVKLRNDFVLPGDVLPRIYTEAEADPLAPGLHVLHGAGGSGKTVNALAMAHYYRRKGYGVVFRAFDEPRGQMLGVAPSKDAVQVGSVNAVIGTELPVYPGDYDDFINRVFGLAQSRTAQTQNKKSVPIAVIDSGTYKLKSLKMTQDILLTTDMPTYPGGLDAGVILGVLHHSQLAASQGVALIMTVNSDLMPTVKEMKGACEGVMSSDGVGYVTNSSRQTGRIWKEFDELAEDKDWALQALRYVTLPPAYGVQSAYDKFLNVSSSGMR